MTKRLEALRASLKIAEHFKLFGRDTNSANTSRLEHSPLFHALKIIHRFDPKDFNSYGEYVNFAVANGIPLTRALRQKMINYDFNPKKLSKISETPKDDTFFTCRRGYPPSYTPK
tara:strand:- start:997 stop:1341 length:345 start_codon:yes stop_codon:yes gene_type:complete